MYMVPSPALIVWSRL